MLGVYSEFQGFLVYNHSLLSEEYERQLNLYLEAAGELGIPMEAVGNDELLCSVVDGELSCGLILDDIDFVIFLDKDVSLAWQLEQLGVAVFNSSECIGICDNKILTMQKLCGSGILMPDTIFAPIQFKAFTGEARDLYLESVVDELGLPLVVKEAFGSYGEQVYLAEDMPHLRVIFEKISGKPHMYQKFVASSRGRDVRLYIVGGGCVGSMERYNIRDFRANISSGGGILPHRPTREVVEIAVRASRLVGATFSGVDILFGENEEPILCEVNSSAHIKNYYDFFGVNLATDILTEICYLLGEE